MLRGGGAGPLLPCRQPLTLTNYLNPASSEQKTLGAAITGSQIFHKKLQNGTLRYYACNLCFQPSGAAAYA